MIELKQGQSTTIGILIADGYDMSNIDNVYLYINQTKFTPAIIDRMLRVEMSSKTTSVFIGTSTVRLIFDDKTFGRREYVLENIVWEATKARVYDDSVDLGYTVTYPITISETAIEAGDVMYDYVKGYAGSLSSVTASVDSNVGTPEVIVTYDGENADFAFKNLKGDKGEQGEQGEKGDDAVLPAGVVIDPNYVHTDNNYTDEDAQKVQSAIQTETDPTVPAWAKEPTKPTYTANEVGLGNVDNTSDASKPISNAAQTALNNKVDKVTGSSLVPDTEITANQIAVKKVNTLTTDGGQLTGFVDPIAVNVSYNGVTRKITLTGDIRAAYKGIPMTEIVPSFVSGWQSEAHDITDGGYFLYFNGTNFVWSAVAWDFKQLMIASVYRDGVNFCLRECHGLMDWQSHESNHNNIGTYLKSGADVSGFILNSDVVANRRPTVSQALVYDEDLPSILPQLTNGLYSRLFLNGANNANLENDKTDIIEYTAGNRFTYNLFTGGVWTKATAANNQYAKVFLMAVPVTSDADCQKNRYIWIMPQTVNATLTTIQNLTPANLSLGQISTALAEYVFVQEFIIRATASGWTIVSTAKLTGNKRFQITASGALATSHTALLDKNAEPTNQHLDTTTEKTTNDNNKIVVIENNAAITMSQDTFFADLIRATNHNNRVVGDLGSPSTDVQNEIALLKFYEPMQDSIKLFYCPHLTGNKFRESGVLKFVSKGYDANRNKFDLTQTNSSSQPYITGNIAPNEKLGLKNPNGGSNLMTHPTISFAANESWSITTVLNDLYRNAESGYCGINIGCRISFCDYVQLNRFFIHSNNVVSRIGTLNTTKFIGKTIVLTVVKDSQYITVYINGVLFEQLQTISDTFSFNEILRGRGRSLYGVIKSHIIRSQALTPTQVTAEYDYLRSVYPEIESVQIGTQTWATSNCEMAATPMGNVIANVTDNTIWASSQTLYDNAYAATSGTVEQKTYAALKAAAMWRNCQNTLDSAAVYGKEYNRFAAKLLKMDIDYFNVANPTALWGWRVSLRTDLTTLALQGGNALKATGTNYWNTANGTNASGFTALGGGIVNADGTNSALKTNAYFLCSDADFAREVKDSDNTFDEVSITTQGGFIRLIKV